FNKNVNRWQELVINEDTDIIKKAYDDLFNNVVNNSKFVFRIIAADGNLKWIEQNITLTKTDLGGLRFDGITKDITKSREQEEISLRNLKAIEQSPISVIITNTDGLIEYVNPYFEKSSGYSFEEIKNTNPRFLKTQHYKKENYAKLWETIKSGEEWKGEFLNKRKNGETYWELATITSIKNDNGEITHYLAVKEDITHIKEIELELISAKEKAEKADKLKDEFLAQMSHEIRTPINAILSFAGLLKDELEDKLEDDMKTCFAIMTRAGKRIIRTIDLILNMAEMHTGYFQPAFEEIDINTRISEAILYDFKQSAADKNIYLNYNYNSTTKTILADEYTFDVIIKNLIDNAIKYTFSGGVEVNVFDSEDNKLAVEVKDTGIGISSEYLPQLFEPFSQEEQGYSRKFEGNGLGLALIKKYTDINGAKIIVDSIKGEGSRFIVFFDKNFKFVS
ncbi:MAG: PAS domain S-box protein, partial [bacterium]